uniref:Uncharacterized protein n=1 Tax=Candidatus Kentrum sp. FW TaxID=2126338 RepID=A0A450SWJ3_9GAMM|nr:MAG: hypothetical protein BECKFW1821A_GA0114235_108113 [Candidatus Kentron sp. FW]
MRKLKTAQYLEVERCDRKDTKPLGGNSLINGFIR